VGLLGSPGGSLMAAFKLNLPQQVATAGRCLQDRAGRLLLALALPGLLAATGGRG